jgi:hypothetical protein
VKVAALERGSSLRRPIYDAGCGSTADTHDDPGSLQQREHLYVENKLAWVEIPEAHTQWPRGPKSS